MDKYRTKTFLPADTQYSKRITEARKNELKRKIVTTVVGRKRYLEKGYNEALLAAEIYENRHNVAAVINSMMKMNFSSYVNMHRIEEAKRILANPEMASLTIEEVSSLVGFSNRQSFYQAFFRATRQTPKEFRKASVEQSKQDKKADTHK